MSFIKENAFENGGRQIATIMSRPQRIKAYDILRCDPNYQW